MSVHKIWNIVFVFLPVEPLCYCLSPGFMCFFSFGFTAETNSEILFLAVVLVCVAAHWTSAAKLGVSAGADAPLPPIPSHSLKKVYSLQTHWGKQLHSSPCLTWKTLLRGKLSQLTWKLRWRSARSRRRRRVLTCGETHLSVLLCGSCSTASARPFPNKAPSFSV